jgi:hypothetical protein
MRAARASCIVRSALAARAHLCPVRAIGRARREVLWEVRRFLSESGRKQLKGIKGRQRVYEVVWE